MEVLEYIQNLAFPVWVRESPSIFAYTSILSLHAIGLAFVVGVHSVVSLRVLGFLPEMPLEPVLKLFPVMYIGFWINAISGLALLSANATGMLTSTMFYIKIGFVGAAVLTLRVMRNRIFTNPMLASGGAVPSEARLLASGALVFWLGAIIAGRLTAYPYFVETWFGL